MIDGRRCLINYLTRRGLVSIVLILFFFPLIAGPSGKNAASPETTIIIAEPTAVIPLAGSTTCHTQGIAFTEKYLFISCVETRTKRAILYQYPLPEGFPEKTTRLNERKRADLTRGAIPAPAPAGSMYHPSGLDYDGKWLWMAVAEYRQYLAHSLVLRLDPETMSENLSFPVEDHIGAVAVMENAVAAMNWDARDVYLLTEEDGVCQTDPSPRQIAYQDCEGSKGDFIICSGPSKIKGKPAAVVDLLKFNPVVDRPDSGWKVKKRRAVITAGVPLGREGFAIVGDYWAFVPEDFPRARLLLFKRPQDF